MFESYGVWDIKSVDVSEDDITAIFTAEEKAKLETTIAILFAACFMLVSFLACSLTLRMESIYSSEKSVDFQ
jgi:hypothetical protein